MDGRVEKVMMKLLTLVCTLTGGVFIFTALKLNICHVTWWSEARIPTKSERGGERNVCS